MVLSSSTGDLRGGLTVSYANACCNESASRARRGGGIARVVGAWVLGACGCAGTLAQAQSAAPAPKPADTSFTWNGITLYGIVDIGLQYQTHGVPASDYFPAGTEAIILPNSNGSITAVTPNNLSQSRVGLSGKEPLAGDWSAVFRLETFFNPQSGNLSDALKSQVLNNGRPLTQQSTNVDSSVAGQLFAGGAAARSRLLPEQLPPRHHLRQHHLRGDGAVRARGADAVRRLRAHQVRQSQLPAAGRLAHHRRLCDRRSQHHRLQQREDPAGVLGGGEVRRQPGGGPDGRLLRLQAEQLRDRRQRRLLR